MKALSFILFLVVVAVSLQAQKPDLVTYYEKSGGMKTPRYDETIQYCKKLVAASPMLHYTVFGKSPQGRELPLLILDKEGKTDPASVKASNKSVLLIQACIHAGECDGKDAGLMLLRDIIAGNDKEKLLDKVTVLFIPIFNVDGHERFGPYNRINQDGPEEMGWRTTAQNLNLNRDYLKADAPEMQAWLKLFNEWQPDFFVDCHVTDGADYQYVATYALETMGNMDPIMTQWVKASYEPSLIKEMNNLNLPIFPYVQFRNWHDPRSGLESWPAPPMLSQGYTAARNRPGLLIETHMLKPYKQRVEATYAMLKITMQILNGKSTELKAAVAKTDARTASKAFREVPYTVAWTTSTTDSVMREFKGFEYSMDSSDLTGGLWFKYDRSKPVIWRIPSFEKCTPEKQVSLPEAYIIPAEWTTVIERLRLHGIRMSSLNRETLLNLNTYRFSEVKWQQRSYEGRHKLTYKLHDSIENHVFAAGSVVIDMNQPGARIIAHLLEPDSPDSFVAWGFFDAIMEQKEYSESYVMETEARKMLAENPVLKAEFERKMAEDAAFAKDPEEILNWFYSRTPWWDSHFCVYPVGRIFDRKTVDGLP